MGNEKVLFMPSIKMPLTIHAEAKNQADTSFFFNGTADYDPDLSTYGEYHAYTLLLKRFGTDELLLRLDARFHRRTVTSIVMDASIDLVDF